MRTDTAQSKRFNYRNWLTAIFRWFSIITIFVFIAEFGSINHIFDDDILGVIGFTGFAGYIIILGLEIIEAESSEFWIYKDEE